MGWVGNNSWTHPPFFWRHLVPQNVGNIIVVCYFLNIAFVIFSILSQNQNGTSLRKNNSGTTTLGTASKSECHNIGKQSTRTFKTLWKTANLFSNLDFSPKSGFPKTLDLSMDFPRIFHGFSTPWPGSLGQEIEEIGSGLEVRSKWNHRGSNGMPTQSVVLYMCVDLYVDI